MDFEILLKCLKVIFDKTFLGFLVIISIKSCKTCICPRKVQIFGIVPIL